MLREILSAAGIILVIVFLIYEIKGWLTGTKIINRKQKGLRISSAVLLVLILGMLLVGDNWAAGRPMLVIYYWTACFTFAVILVVLTLLDIKEVAKNMSNRQMHMVVGLIDPSKEEDREDQDNQPPTS